MIAKGLLTCAHANRRGQAGFTLAEVLVAMFIFSLISVGTMMALTSSLSGKTQMNTRIEYLTQIETMRALVRADMANIRPRLAREAFGTNALYVMTGGVNTLMSFTRAGRNNPGGIQARGDLQRVSYVFEDGALLRRVLAHENPAPTTPEIDRVLISGLSNANIDFTQNQDLGTANPLTTSSILAVPPGDFSGIPEMITLTLDFENGDQLEQYFEVGK